MADTFISYGKQAIDEDDIAAVVQVLQSDWLTQGPAIERFERELLKVTGAAHATAVASATAALHIACLALGAGKGTRVWTSPNSFVASSNCALYCGATVDFVDIDPITYNMSISALGEKLARAERNGLLPDILIPVHFSGQSCDMRAIGELSNRYGFRVIEDASHAIGGSYNGKPIGVCEFSEICVFSFHPVKIVTTAEGGAALTNDAGLAAKLDMLRSHGITRDQKSMDGPSEGSWYYQQIMLGYNYRMTDMQAALGSSQLTRLGNFISRRHEIADHYDCALANLPITTPIRVPDGISALHLYVILLEDAGRRGELFDYLRAAGIGVNVHYIPIHLQPYYRALGFSSGDFPVAEDYYARAISIPMHPGLDRNDLDRVCGTLVSGLL
jgi:UDP-4-amino-4,6-dideoxy-N-acetyl-beta-L-altrosamine transaminase